MGTKLAGEQIAIQSAAAYENIQKRLKKAWLTHLT
jgi:hypothetical protein